MTRITCCRCDYEYPLVLFSDDAKRHFTSCPSCQSVHQVTFNDVKHPPRIGPASSIRLKDWNGAYSGDRIADASRADQSGSDGGDVVDWLTSDAFIVCVMMWSDGKDTVAEDYELRWRNETDIGTFAPLGATGELKYTTSTGLSDGTAVTSGEGICTQPTTYQSTNTGECEDGTPSNVAMTDPECIELQIAVDPADATGGKRYEFQLYSLTQSAAVATLGSLITMMVLLIEKTPNPGTVDVLGVGPIQGLGIFVPTEVDV